ncbi:unnamed protein product [Closterium sp. NIES-64]|nr:unnamed protein product [Closterium sp. NIES-64]CAI6001646.1 unnamed protein product [Closterium sp. NIES-65]
MEAALGCRVRPRDAVGSAAPLAARRCPSGRSARAASSPDSLAPRPLLLRAALHPLQPRRHQLGASRLRLPQLGLRPPVSARRPHRPPSRVARAALVAESASSESRDNVTVTGDAEAQLRAASAAEGRAEEGGTVEWSRAWYAVGVTADMDATRPHAITVVGRPLVLWRDAAGSWRCFLDQCPHRLVALSEGRIDAEGRLACSYHGWAFAGSGACELIPQAAPEHPGQPPRAVCSPRACATAFPVREFHGMLFVWPNEHSAQQAEATPLPLPHGVEWEEYEVLPHYTRRLAYGYEVLVENVVDLSHFPFAHHGVGMTTRDKGGPISNIGMTQSGVKGFEGPIDVFGFPTYLRFQAPQLVFYHSTVSPPPPKFPFLQRKAGANTSLVLLLYITPSAPGSSIVVQVNLVRPGDGKKLPSVPRWLRHIGLHQIYDGDSYFLHCQERVLQEREQQMEEARASKGEARQGGGAAEGGRSEAGGAGVVRGSAWRAFYMPTNADLPVVAFRQWLSKYAGVSHIRVVAP